MVARRLIALVIGSTTPLACGAKDAPAANDSGEKFHCTSEPATCADCADCSECVDEKCADLLPYCSQDDACTCMVDCVRSGGVGAVDGCLADLGLEARPTGFPGVEECVAFACPDVDECATPNDWTPPDADLVCDGKGSGGVGGGSEPDCAFDPELDFDPLGTVLQLESLDKGICARIERRDAGDGSMQNTSWELIDIRVGPLGAVAHVSDPDDLCWYSSHHNFQDWVHVWTGSRYFELALKEDGHGGSEEGHDGARRYHLYVFEDQPANAATCAPTADGIGCISGPIILYAHEPP